MRRECLYKPFLMSLMGAALIIGDNFVLGEKIKMHHIPSWIGNGLLIASSLWSGRD